MTKKVKVIEIVVVTIQELHSPDFCYPSRYAFRNAVGDMVFIKTSKRSIAEQYVKDNYDGIYAIREL